jgi:AcrR family transcriptional regulator
VIEAAARVFFRRGYADASVQDVADELGILKGSLYHYIDSKEDLLFRLLQETHDDVDRILDEVVAVDGLAPLERLHLYVAEQVRFNLDNLAKVAVYYHDIESLSEKRRREIYSRRKVHERFVVDLVEQAQRNGDGNPGLDPVMLSRCIFATIIWTYRWYRPGKGPRQEVAEMCAAFALRGVVGARA